MIVTIILLTLMGVFFTVMFCDMVNRADARVKELQGFDDNLLKTVRELRQKIEQSKK